MGFSKSPIISKAELSCSLESSLLTSAELIMECLPLAAWQIAQLSLSTTTVCVTRVLCARTASFLHALILLTDLLRDTA